MAASEEKEQQSRAAQSSFESSIQSVNTSNVCSKFQRPVKNLVGVIGPASSTVTIQVSNFVNQLHTYF